MVRPGGALCWIDFQDALLGPRVYDLVALLNDSYQVFDRPFVEARLDDYARPRGSPRPSGRQLDREFDVVTVQRKLKDAGRFVFIDRVKETRRSSGTSSRRSPRCGPASRASRTTTTCARSPRSSTASSPEPCRAAVRLARRRGPRPSASACASPHGLDLGGRGLLPLWAGAMHYWRHRPGEWRAGLEAMRAMGLRLVDTYVPWGVHETAPGEFDFGERDPRLDVARFLRIAHELGPALVLRPGRTSTPS